MLNTIRGVHEYTPDERNDPRLMQAFGADTLLHADDH
jgi:hypothetical protein